MNNFLKNIKSFLHKISNKNQKNIRINSKEKINFLEQLSSLVNSGIPILNSLKIISYQTKNKSIKKLINIVTDDINKGVSLKESCENIKNIFNKFDTSIIEMGELTGKIGESLELIKEKEEKTRELKGKIIGALIYPMVIISLSTAMVIVFMIYVIPKIQEMYRDAKVNLPELTQTIIDISIFLQENITNIIIGIIVFILLFTIFKKHKKTKIYYDIAILHIPILGPLLKKKALALFSSSLGTLLSRGIIINKALETSAGALDNAYYEKRIKKVIAGVSSGKDLSDMMGIRQIQSKKQDFLFPVELSSAVKIGEQTGKLPKLLLKISLKYNKEIDNIVKNLATAIEPIVIVGVGLIVGTIIMSIMLPFFNMVNVI